MHALEGINMEIQTIHTTCSHIAIGKSGFSGPVSHVMENHAKTDVYPLIQSFDTYFLHVRDQR